MKSLDDNNNNNNNNNNNSNKCEQFYCHNMQCVDPLLAITSRANSTTTTTTLANNLKQQQQHALYHNKSTTSCLNWHQRADCDCLPYDEQPTSHLLLQGSDDPLIGRGANSVIIDDDHPIELADYKQQFRAPQQQSKVEKCNTTTTTTNYAPTIWSSIIKQKLKDKAKAQVQAKAQALANKQFQMPTTTTTPVTTTKNEPKLRFHHQALPLEYLQHYNEHEHSSKESTKLPATKSAAKGNVRSWLKNIVEIQKNAQQQQITTKNDLNFADLPKPISLVKEEAADQRCINFTDLPYMGEITLNNSRPRRGRKPKKANICHLIYKNYGTIILGEPKIANCDCPSRLKAVQEPIVPPDFIKNNAKIGEKFPKCDTLPLNLCLRDQSEPKSEPMESSFQVAQNVDRQKKAVLKRKRSALFIPPKPAENTLSPATEVSICKFKFTGGVKPLLQEKKMLSVDSDGNYKYFNGHNAHSAKNSVDQETAAPPKLQDLNEKLQQRLLSSRKKKLSRRSERERLEKTFKEKGFLIQTQQLQSAEGATYCKFRQLKKFTRYLFRNWKDYLPNDFQDANNKDSVDPNPQELQINESVENYFKEKEKDEIEQKVRDKLNEN